MHDKCRKRCSISLVLKELQLRTTMRHQYTTIIMNNIKKAVKDVSKGMEHCNAHTLLVGM